jgi:hypothetical protein
MLSANIWPEGNGFWCALIIGRLSGSGSSIPTQRGSRDGCTRSTLTLRLTSNIVQASCTRCSTDFQDCRRPTWAITGASDWEPTLKVISCLSFSLVGQGYLVWFPESFCFQSRTVLFSVWLLKPWGRLATAPGKTCVAPNGRVLVSVRNAGKASPRTTSLS